MKRLFRYHSPVVAFVILALVGGLAIRASAHGSADLLYRSQIAGCVRGNITRKETNRQASAQQAEAGVLQGFLIAARQARRASGTPIDLKAAKEYTRLILVVNKITFKPLPQINCVKIIPRP